MTIFEQIASKIIKEQELVIGPLAWIEARKVPGLQIMETKNAEVSIPSPEAPVIDRLVAQYERLFGRASQEVCRTAAAPFLVGLNMSEIPVSLR
jgi:hypothetical protein